MREVRVFSPAKINLFLEVVSRRADGFHEIKTLFQAIDLCDELRVEALPGDCRIEIACDAQELPVGPANLAYRAAEYFLQACRVNSGVRISIRKRIPVAGGLGGGSSNAACTLLAMNKLFGRPLSNVDLMGLAEKLGSDVPFFLRCVPSVGIGKGHEIIGLRQYLPFWLVLAGPVGPVRGDKTASIYKALKIGLTNSPRPITITLAALETKNLKQLASNLYNRLEEVVFLSLRGAKRIKNTMRDNGALGALVSGAGPTVFGIVASRKAGMELAKKIQRRLGSDIWVRVVKTIPGLPGV